MIRIMICDDEPLARERLQRMVAKVPQVVCVGEAASGHALLQQIPALQPDLILLDVRMPGMNGIEAAARLCESEQPPAIIFCTAYDSHAMDAFQVNAVDYLLKPVRQEALQAAIEKAHRTNRLQLQALQAHLQPIPSTPEDVAERQRDYISAQHRGGVELVAVADVRYFLADQKYVTARHSQGETLIDETLKDLEQEFSRRLVRIHRNALVALDYLAALELQDGHYQVRLHGVDERLTVSRRHVAAVKRMLRAL